MPVLRPRLLPVLRLLPTLRSLPNLLLAAVLGLLAILRLPVLRLLPILLLVAILRLLAILLLPVLRPLLITVLRLVLLAILRRNLIAVYLIERAAYAAVLTLRLVHRPRLRGAPVLASQRPLGNNPVRAAVVAIEVGIPIAHGRLDVPLLEGGPLEALPAIKVAFLAVRRMSDSTRPTVKGHTAVTVHIVAAPVIAIVVGVPNETTIHAPDGGVVVEEAIMPPPTNKADTEVTEAIVDAAIVAHIVTPVTGMPIVEASGPAPVAGGPQRADKGRRNPRAGNPVVAVGTISPVTRSPDHARARAKRLLINKQWRRSISYADEYAGMRGRGNQRHCKSKQKPSSCSEKFHDCLLFNPFQTPWSI